MSKKDAFTAMLKDFSCSDHSYDKIGPKMRSNKKDAESKQVKYPAKNY